MRLRRGWILAAALTGAAAGAAAAEPAGCADLADRLETLTGYRIAAPVAGSQGGWCVFDRAVLTARGAPEIAAERLRLRGAVATDVIDLALEAGGVRLAPGLGQRDLDPILRETLRLQVADLAFMATAGPEGLAVRGGRLRLSGGTVVEVEADVAGAGLSAGSLLPGRLTWARLDWRNDGRLFRPVMESWGESLVDGADGGAAVDAARLALRQIARNLPGSLFQGEGQDRLEDALAALPQGRGRLALEFRSTRGIGAAQVAMAALSGDPLGPEALARLFAGAEMTVDWQPGLAP
ncbi:hypothetical protein [Tabrizicola sp.]|uniref:hypothetical protein n=1 Tax=Tabrizicola sp. TaxID=2005166 RepID=UPI00273474AF|nr:hypothetical protein [Tabrizicola sp.]MDP3197041.1 hypothetical protein [Tabrizicola sp.]MDZ4068940.1 hypothetical protein [Tabrizicola sp.]